LSGMNMSLNELLKFRNYSHKFYEGTVTTVEVDTKDDPFDVGPFKEATFFLSCTAFAGTTLNVKFVQYDPATGVWFDLVSFTELSDVGAEVKVQAANLGEKVAVVIAPVGAGDKVLKVGSNFKIM